MSSRYPLHRVLHLHLPHGLLQGHHLLAIAHRRQADRPARLSDGSPAPASPPPARDSPWNARAESDPVGFPAADKCPRTRPGFCVAITMNGRGSGWVWPSADTCRSLIDSNRALCVRGVARLISSASTTLAKIGPALKTNSRVWPLYMLLPVMSAGQQIGRELDAMELAGQAARRWPCPSGSCPPRACPPTACVRRPTAPPPPPHGVGLAQHHAGDVLLQQSDQLCGIGGHAPSIGGFRVTSPAEERRTRHNRYAAFLACLNGIHWRPVRTAFPLLGSVIVGGRVRQTRLLTIASNT